MKAKVIIENGKAEIILTPEYDFEKNLIESCREYDIQARCSVEYYLGQYTNHQLRVTVNSKLPNQQITESK